MDPALLDEQLTEIDWTVLPAGAVRDRVAAPSGSLARITLGPPGGRRVVLVPGATGSKEDFLRMMPLLAEAGYRVEAFDMAGHFQSVTAGPGQLALPTAHFTLELFINDLTAVVTQGSTPVHLLGYSFAGTVAAATAAHRPDVVSTLTLLGTPPMSGRVFRGIKRVGWLAGLAGPRLSAAVMLRGIRWNLTRVGRSRQAFVRARLHQIRRDTVRDIMRLMTATPDLVARLRAGAMPTLVAVGTGDLWPVELHREFAAALGADFAVYRAGHSPCETAPHQLVADMLRLFERVDGRVDGVD